MGKAVRGGVRKEANGGVKCVDRGKKTNMPEIKGLSQDEIVSSWTLAEYFGKINPIMLLYALTLTFSTKDMDKRVIWGKMLLGMVAFGLSAGDNHLADYLTEGFRELLEDIDFDFYDINMNVIN